MNRMNNKKINEALDLLNEAAKEKKDEVYKLIGEKYLNIKDSILEAFSESKTVIDDAKKSVSDAVVNGVQAGQEKIKEKAEEVDSRVRENPWPFLGGVAAVCLAVGFFISRRRRERDYGNE
jgi:ElaB/YqjD/DUF883 family membrane-anchored ribosome-binding protein